MDNRLELACANLRALEGQIKDALVCIEDLQKANAELQAHLDITRAQLTEANRWNAAGLLECMRPQIEKDLEYCRGFFGDLMPTCPSQNHRAKRTIELIKNAWGSYNATTKHCLLRIWNRFEQFNAVWTAVNIMEYPDNHKWIYGEEKAK